MLSVKMEDEASQCIFIILRADKMFIINTLLFPLHSLIAHQHLKTSEEHEYHHSISTGCMEQGPMLTNIIK